MTGLGSRQVAYLPVYELVAPLLGRPGLVPGTPQWVALDDTDPAKWRAIMWSAVWWAVAEDGRQAALADASREISTAADWPGLASAIHRRRTSAAYIPRVA